MNKKINGIFFFFAFVLFHLCIDPLIRFVRPLIDKISLSHPIGHLNDRGNFAFLISIPLFSVTYNAFALHTILTDWAKFFFH